MTRAVRGSTDNLPRLTHVARHVVELRDEIEPFFNEAGHRLSRTADVLAQIKGPLQALAEQNDGGGLDQLRNFAARHKQDQTGLASELAVAIGAIRDMESCIERVHGQIGLIERDVLTMKFIVINARIAVTAMTDARNSLEFFTHGATEVVDEALKLLSNLGATMRRLQLGAKDVRERSELLTARVAQNIQLASNHLNSSIDRFSSQINALSRASADIAGQSNLLLSATTQAVVALQIGDMTRQRLDHIATIFDHANQADDPGPLQALGFAQLADTAKHHQAGARSLKKNAQDLERGVLQLSQQHLSPFADTDHGSADLASNLEMIDASTHDTLLIHQALRETAARLEEYPRTLHDLISQGDGFAESIRMIGLNAVIVCSGLGQNGMALKHLQLQDLAAKSAGQLQNIKSGRTEISERSAKISDQLSKTTNAKSVDPAADLCVTINAIGALVSDAQSVAATAQKGFVRDRITFIPLERQCEKIAALAIVPDCVPISVEPFIIDPPISSEIFSIYTMEQERLIHRAICSEVTVRSTAISQPPTDLPSGDDIFF